MIFVTVGTQLGFPRLLKAMDQIAPELGEDVIAQCGPDSIPAGNLDIRKFLQPSEFESLFAKARLIVAHAGIGTILSAKAYGKPLILLPRRHDLGEHRNDHQMATARFAEGLKGIRIAWDESDLRTLILRKNPEPAGPEPGPNHARLVARIRHFIEAV